MILLLGQALSNFLRFIGNVAMSRLLLPEAFGLMAIVRMVITGFEMLSNVGIQASIIRHPRGGEVIFLDTAWTIQVSRGFLLALTGLVAAVPISRFYRDDELLLVLPVTALSAAALGFQSTKLVSLTRQLALGRVTAIDLVVQLTALVGMLAFAALSPSVWALVFGAVFAAAARAVLSFTWVPGRGNSLRWEPDAAREILDFGRWIFVSSAFTFLATQIDVILLGRLIDLTTLGVYYIASMVAGLPREVASRLIQGVLLPALAESYRESFATLALDFQKARRLIVPAGVVSCAGLAIACPALFQILYDDRYAAGAWMAQLLLLGFWFSYLHEANQRALTAMGDSRSLAVSNAVKFTITLIGCLVGFQLASLQGLLVGIALGSFAGYAIIATALHQQQLRVWGTDLSYTALGLIVVAVPSIVLRLVSEPFDESTRPFVEVGIGGLVLAIPAFRLYRRVRQGFGFG